ncbi:MAG: sulfotransferase family protein [Flavobacteriales bacterium]|nr:MAG: sulfotransferase family protein [Flavobacteriales bacterium]
MYSFAQRGDTIVFDEPLYAYYLSNTVARKYHPDAELIINSMENNGEKVIDIMTGYHKASVVFFKNMTHHLLNLNKDFLSQGLNIILTRDPKEMLPSFHKVIPNPTLKDVGYQEHLDLIDQFERRNAKYIVMDSKMILENPSSELNRLCHYADIPFTDEMLSWKSGARREDGLWAKHWYKNIHRSTGFLEYRQKTENFPNQLLPLLKECIPRYNRIIEKIK